MEHNQCSICYEEMGEHTLTTACHHKFCTGCLTRHLVGPQNSNRECPLCRRVLYDATDSFQPPLFIDDEEEEEEGDDDDSINFYDGSDQSQDTLALSNSRLTNFCVFPIDGRIKFIILSPDESENNRIETWDYPSRLNEGTLDVSSVGELFFICPVNINGKMKIIYSDETSAASIKIWDYETKLVDQTLKGNSSRFHVVSIVSFSGDNGELKIVSGDITGTINIFDYNSGNCERTFIDDHRRDDGGELYLSTHSINGKRKIIVSNHSRTIKIWDYHSGSCEEIIRLEDLANCHTYEHHYLQSIYTIQVNGTIKIIFCHEINKIKIWDYETRSLEILEMEREIDFTSNSTVSSLFAFFYNERLKILSGHDDQAIRIWDCETKVLDKIFTGHRNRVTNVCYFLDNEEKMKIVSCCEDSTMKIWEIFDDDSDFKN